MSGFKQQALTHLKKQMQELASHTALKSLQQKDWQPDRRASDRVVRTNLSEFDKHLPEEGLQTGVIHEFVPARYSDFPATLGFTLCLLKAFQKERTGPVLWCSFGKRADFPNQPYPHGLTSLGFNPNDLLQVSVTAEQEFLWVLEEGLASGACPLVIGAYVGPERLYDFTASRRLALRASRRGSTLLLVRNYSSGQESEAQSSTAAQTRWRISARPSSPEFFQNTRLPGVGCPRWQVELVRCKSGRPHIWQLEWQYETHSFRLASPLVDRTSISPTTRPKTRISPFQKRFYGRRPHRRTG
ncbi:ImuA family protein [Sneathiella limimaris]|uniref:ImuA family protein n=1 Tax=Sneathiella limimaris TaxID=1964213 RepID=UPI001F0D1A4E|nr:hypothetical protein [Sneathiella limimaris]